MTATINYMQFKKFRQPFKLKLYALSWFSKYIVDTPFVRRNKNEREKKKQSAKFDVAVHTYKSRHMKLFQVPSLTQRFSFALSRGLRSISLPATVRFSSAISSTKAACKVPIYVYKRTFEKKKETDGTKIRLRVSSHERDWKLIATLLYDGISLVRVIYFRFRKFRSTLIWL